jgi:hypothetical protein
VEFEKCDAAALLVTQQKWVHIHHNGVVHALIIMDRFRTPRTAAMQLESRPPLIVSRSAGQILGGD